MHDRHNSIKLMQSQGQLLGKHLWANNAKNTQRQNLYKKHRPM